MEAALNTTDLKLWFHLHLTVGKQVKESGVERGPTTDG